MLPVLIVPVGQPEHHQHGLGRSCSHDSGNLGALGGLLDGNFFPGLAADCLLEHLGHHVLGGPGVAVSNGGLIVFVFSEIPVQRILVDTQQVGHVPFGKPGCRSVYEKFAQWNHPVAAHAAAGAQVGFLFSRHIMSCR